MKKNYLDLFQYPEKNGISSALSSNLTQICLHSDRRLQ
jgi:hypothetical protein